MTITYEEQLKQNAKKGASLISDYFNNIPVHDMKLKLSSGCISQFNNFIRTKGALHQLKFQIDRAIAKDRKELKKIATRPALPE